FPAGLAPVYNPPLGFRRFAFLLSARATDGNRRTDSGRLGDDRRARREHLADCRGVSGERRMGHRQSALRNRSPRLRVYALGTVQATVPDFGGRGRRWRPRFAANSTPVTVARQFDMSRFPIRRDQLPPGEVLCTYCTGLCCRYFTVSLDTPTTWTDFDNIRWY